MYVRKLLKIEAARKQLLNPFFPAVTVKVSLGDRLPFSELRTFEDYGAQNLVTATFVQTPIWLRKKIFFFV